MNSADMMESTAQTLVVGATGVLGLETVNILHGTGAAIRALVRPSCNPEKRAALERLPIQLVTGDLKDEQSLAVACRDIATVVSTATAIMSRHPGDSIETVDLKGQLALVDAAEREGVKRFVYISFLPSKVDSAFQRAKRAVETRLQESGMDFTILQSAAFMEVWISPALGFEPSKGEVRILGDGTNPVSWISIHDVARFAAAASTHSRFARRILSLGGPDALSPLQVLGIFEELGVRFNTRIHVPIVAIEAMLTNAPNPEAEALAASMLTAARGQAVDPQPAQQLLPGRLVPVRDHVRQMLR